MDDDDFGGGKVSLPPAPAPPPADTSATDVQKELAAQRALARARRGRAATALTQGVGGSLLNEPTSSLLGGTTST